MNKKDLMPIKAYSSSFTVKKDGSKITELIERKIAEAKECSMHMWIRGCSGNNYRLYRRGKNRCPRCGVKLNDK